MAVPRDEGKAAVRALYYSEWFLSDGTKAAYGDAACDANYANYYCF